MFVYYELNFSCNICLCNFSIRLLITVKSPDSVLFVTYVTFIFVIITYVIIQDIQKLQFDNGVAAVSH